MARGTISNTQRATAKLDDLSREGRRLVSRAVYAGADLIATEAALSITRGSVSGKGHVPSKPGEPPNADTRQLDRSIIAVQTGELEARVQVNAPYASALEFGTSKMAARPFLGPAVAKTRAEVVGTLFRTIKRARGLS